MVDMVDKLALWLYQQARRFALELFIGKYNCIVDNRSESSMGMQLRLVRELFLMGLGGSCA